MQGRYFACEPVFGESQNSIHEFAAEYLARQDDFQVVAQFETWLLRQNLAPPSRQAAALPGCLNLLPQTEQARLFCQVLELSAQHGSNILRPKAKPLLCVALGMMLQPQKVFR